MARAGCQKVTRQAITRQGGGLSDFGAKAKLQFELRIINIMSNVQQTSSRLRYRCIGDVPSKFRRLGSCRRLAPSQATLYGPLRFLGVVCLVYT
jgi:hypothetical protein